MGLDNGILVRKNDTVNKLFIVNKNCLYDYTDSFEIAYWRKCWNVRTDIFDITESWANDNFYTPLDRDDICNIIKLLKSYNKKTWDRGDSIWTWKEHKRCNRRHIRYLRRLARLMKKYPDLEVYFYDSY